MTGLGAAMPRGAAVVVPVKARQLAKSRLHPPPGLRRSELAHAFALDTLEVAAACLAPGRLVVVTADGPTRRFALDRQALVVPDPGDGLNAALRRGLAEVVRLLGDGPAAVLLGDLPALRAEELDTALRRCLALPLAVVPDIQGTGTVLLTAQAASQVVPRFGAGSAAAHERGGHVRLELDLPGLRTDVDDDRALRVVRAIGTGRHTAAVLAGAD